MPRPCRFFAFSCSRGPGFAWRAAFSSVVLAVGCAGPPIPAAIDGIPVCPDFTTGNARMEGGLRYPVRLRVLDGKTVLFKTVIAGLRHADDPKPRSFIADDNAR